MIAGQRSFHDHALLPSPLGRRDTRVKLLLLLSYTLAIVSTPPGAWLVFSGYAVLLAIALGASRLPLAAFFRSYLFLLPLLAGVALFIPFHAGGSHSGWLFFQSVAAKSLLATGGAIVLAATTPFPHITAALEWLRVPRLLVVILAFTYRYLFVLVEEAQRMLRARDSRGYRPRHIGQAVVIGQMAGSLFLRSHDRAERIHRAMLSRGYTQESSMAPALQPWGVADAATLLLSIAAIGLLVISRF